MGSRRQAVGSSRFQPEIGNGNRESEIGNRESEIGNQKSSIMAKIGIIGGGISGLMAAYYLQKDGHEVHVLDRGDFSEGCSHGNAGMIVPSHIIPLAAPGVVIKGLKWLLDKKSPFAIVPSLDKDLIYWLFAFHRAATEANVQRAIPQLAALSLFSKKAVSGNSRSGRGPARFAGKRSLMLCQPAEHEEHEVALLANSQGIQAIPMTPDELAVLDPSVRYTVRSAVYYPGDAVMTCRGDVVFVE